MGVEIMVIDSTNNQWAPYATPFTRLPPEDTFVLETTKPIGTSILPFGSGGNVGTGVIRPEPTIHVFGNITLTNASPTITDRIIHGSVSVSSGVTVPWLVENCEIIGLDAGSTGGLVDCTNSTAAGTVRFCRIHPTIPNKGIDGIRTRNYTSYRNEIYNTVDGHASFDNRAGSLGHNYTYIWGNHCHDSALMLEPAQGNGITHNDTLVQVQGGDNWEVIGNNGEGFVVAYDGLTPPTGNVSTSAIMLNVGSSAPRNFINGLIRGNWLNGGAYAINGQGVLNNSANVTITNNRFGRTGYNSGIPPFTGDATATVSLKTTSSTNQWPGAYPTNTTNVYEDNGHLILVRSV